MTATVDLPWGSTELGSFARRSDALERFLRSVLDGDDSLPDECRVFVRGGKRLRARLVLASAGGSSRLDEGVALFQAAAALEIFHAASLLHDDIVDRAETRRDAPAMHRRMGVRGATLSGWYLGQLALALMAELPHSVRQRFAEAGKEMSRGQLAEIVRAYDTGVLPEDRLAIMAQKTAAVFGLACELGGVLGGGDVDSSRLRRLGDAVGMLFQIADDVDDLYAAPRDLGREPGADLEGGVISLLVAFALQTEIKGAITDILHAVPTLGTSHAVDRCRQLIRSSGALNAVYDMAEHYAQAARGHLSVLPRADGTDWMRSLVDATILRVRKHVVDAPHD